METKYQITIPKPCHEDWNAMDPDPTGKFCGSCVKNVVDFTNMEASEIQAYFVLNSGKKVCGRFKNEQVNKFNLEIPQSVLNKKMPFRKAFLLTLFVVMGSTLFSCRNNDGSTLGEVAVVNDTIAEKPEIKEPVLLGEVIARPNDSLNPLAPKPPEPKIDEVKFVKAPHLKGKIKCEGVKTESDSKPITTMGLVNPKLVRDSIRVEKK